MLLKGSCVTIRLMTRADLAQMAAWRPYDDPLYADANWMQRPPHHLDRWYARRSADPQRALYVIVDKAGRVIGSITLREINGRRSARLGITLGADFAGLGYGTKALELFLDYYFDELGFEKMVLDVAGYNRRAIRVYDKLGFVRVAQLEQAAGRGKMLDFIKEPRYENAVRFFRRDWLGRYWLTCYDMALTREEWVNWQTRNSRR